MFVHTTFIFLWCEYRYFLHCVNWNYSHLFQFQICTRVCEGHNSRWVRVCWLNLTGSLAQFHWSEYYLIRTQDEDIMEQETWISDNFSTIPLPPFVSSTCASFQLVKLPWFSHQLGKFIQQSLTQIIHIFIYVFPFLTTRYIGAHLISKPDHHGLHRSVALKMGHWGHLITNTYNAAALSSFYRPGRVLTS